VKHVSQETLRCEAAEQGRDSARSSPRTTECGVQEDVEGGGDVTTASLPETVLEGGQSLLAEVAAKDDEFGENMVGFQIAGKWLEARQTGKASEGGTKRETAKNGAAGTAGQCAADRENWSGRALRGTRAGAGNVAETEGAGGCGDAVHHRAKGEGVQ
jgi:hypothetical protein